MPISDAQRTALESLQSRIMSHLKIKNLNMAQVEFYDLLRKVESDDSKTVARTSWRRCRRRGTTAEPRLIPW